jgi:hypothetical protein
MEPEMTQTLLSFDTPAAAPLDRVGFDIGWDHARHALVPPAELMLDGTPVSQGWLAGPRGVRPPQRGRHTRVRQWLALRLQAWREGADFDTLQVTPHHLVADRDLRIARSRAPRWAGSGDDAPVITRLRRRRRLRRRQPGGAEPPGRRTRQAGCSAQALERAERLRACTATLDGLEADAWTRLATLMSLAVELPQVQAARIACACCPPTACAC